MPGDDESMSDEAIWETLPVSLIILSFIELFCEAILNSLRMENYLKR